MTAIEKATKAAREAAEKADPLFETIYDREFEAIAKAVLQSLDPPDEGMVRAMFEVARNYEGPWEELASLMLTAAIQHMIEGEGNEPR